MHTNLIFRQLLDYETFTYTYIVGDPKIKEAIIIDPVKEQVSRDLQVLGELELTLTHILDTHVHADHITGSGDLRKATGAKIVLSKNANVDCADIHLGDGDEIQFGNQALRALATPGHTSTCTCYHVDNMVFTGDALLIRGCGRTDFQEGSPNTLYESIHQKLFTLPDDTKVFPGHDYQGRTMSTIGEEKSHNPRLNTSITKEEFCTIMDNLNLDNPKKIDVAVPANLKCGLT